MNPSSSYGATSLLLSAMPEERSRRKQLAYATICHRPAAPKLPTALSASAREARQARSAAAPVLAQFSPRSVIPTIFSYVMAATTTTLHSQKIGKYSSLCLLLIAVASGVEGVRSQKKHKAPAYYADHDVQQDISPMEFVELCASSPELPGCQPQEVEKRKSAYMRFGRSAPQLAGEGDAAAAYDNFEKRKSAYMRFGKRFSPYEGGEFEQYAVEPAMEKRKSAYMRFGKRKSAYMRFGKRSELDDTINAMEKRKSAYMRFGKRSLLANNSDDKNAATQMEKRKSAYMRFGRK